MDSPSPLEPSGGSASPSTNPPITFVRRDGLAEFGPGDNPTAMAVAPDGRLFVGTVSGNIYALTIDSITHQVTSTVKFTSVHNLPNTNDDGTPASVTGRIVLGMTFDPAHPTDLYVSDGDPRLYTCSTNTRSGTITKVDIGSGTAVNVVTGLPKSRRDHNVEGIHFGPDGFLYVSVGAMTNLGAPSVWFGMQAESYLSASILKIDVHSIESSPGSVDLSNVIGASTMPATVSFFVEGTRNAFDFQFEQVNGTTYMYINDNGSNHGFGTTPAGGDGCPSGQAIDPPDLEDTLFRVPLNHLGIFYAGHPNPARGQCVLDDGVSADGTMLYSPTLTPDPNYQPPVMYYGASGGSVNGMTVYPAGVNGGAMAGDLISATFSDDNLLRRVTVDPTSELPTNIPVGSTLAPTSEYQFRNPLTLAADGISGALLGTIFVAESDLWTAGTAEIDALFPQGGGQESLGTLNPTNYNFGSSDVLQAGGWLSAPRQSFAFTNTSGLPINISGVALGGANPSDFQVGSACGGSLAVGASCTVNVTSTPGSIGEKTASVVISDDAPDSPQKIQVMEAGVIQQFGTGTLSFPLTRIGATASQTVTFTNPTSIGTPIHVSQVALTGSGAADYSLTDGCTGHGVAGQQSCSVTVFFTPTVLGSLPANLVLKDDASGSQATTPITGSGGRGFFFAEGFTGTGFTESLNLLMPNQSGTATIDYYTPWAHTTQSVNLTAGKVATVDVAAVVSAPQQPVSALVTLPAEGVAERVMHFNFGQWHGSTDIVGTQSTAEEWDFAEGSTLPAFDEYLTLQNPNPVPANATLNYFTDSGANPIKQLILPAQSRTTVEVFSGGLNSVSGCVPGGAGANCGVGRGQGGVGVKVTTDQPVVVERPMYVDGHDFGSGPINDGHVALGANSPATQWNFAEGTTLAGFNEYLTLANTSNSDAHTTIVYQDEAGHSTTKSPVVNAHSRLTIEVFNPAWGVGPGVGGVSAQVTSDVPIVAERPMYMVHDFGTGSVAGASVVVGSTTLGTNYGFAAGSTAAGDSDYLTIENPNSLWAEVALTYYPGGAAVVKDVAVPPASRTTIEMFGTQYGIGPGVASMGVTVSSTEPVLVEKPTYGSNSSTYGATDTTGYASPGF